MHDVAAGAALGSASSHYFTKPYKGVSVAPIAGHGFYGAVVSGDW